VIIIGGRADQSFPAFMKTFTRQDVAQNNSEKSAWIIIDTFVYDVTKFAPAHPGGELLLLQYAGKDVTEEFYAFHRQEILTKYEKFKIGQLVNESPKIIYRQPGDFSPVPYGEPSHLQGFHSPYYTYFELM
jgi:cytochrome b involved in lipid metabolism